MKKTDYKQCIIDFMDYKNVKMYDVNKPLYFNKSDRGDISKWDETGCEIVWDKIIIYLVERSTKELLFEDTIRACSEICPFCLYALVSSNNSSCGCNICKYAKNHGDCNNEGSDYRTFWKSFRFLVKDLIKQIDVIKEKNTIETPDIKEEEGICESCGQLLPLKEKTNLEKARETVDRFEDSYLSGNLSTVTVRRIVKEVSEQYEKAIIDAKEDMKEEIIQLISGLYSGYYCVASDKFPEHLSQIKEKIISRLKEIKIS